MPRRRSVPIETPPENTGPVGYVESVWMQVGEILPHPDNVRTHPPEQVAVYREQLTRNGFLKPVILNRTTGRLLDGHLRLQVALEDGETRLPVNVVEIPEEAEAEVLAALDGLPTMARIDPSRFSALRERLRAGPPAGEFTSRLLEAMRSDPFFRDGLRAFRGPSEPPPLEADPDEGPQPSVPLATAGAGASIQAPVSATRMVTLFYADSEHARFLELVRQAQDALDQDNASDAVLAALEAWAEMVPAMADEEDDA